METSYILISQCRSWEISSETTPSISLENLTLNGPDKEVIFLGGGLMYYESCLIAIESFNLGGLCSEVVYTNVKTNQKYPTLITIPFHYSSPFHHSIPLNPDAHNIAVT